MSYEAPNDFRQYSELYHHGVEGMHWGVRRYQDKNGSLTPLGRKHNGVGESEESNKSQPSKKAIRKGAMGGGLLGGTIAALISSRKAKKLKMKQSNKEAPEHKKEEPTVKVTSEHKQSAMKTAVKELRKQGFTGKVSSNAQWDHINGDYYLVTASTSEPMHYATFEYDAKNKRVMRPYIDG